MMGAYRECQIPFRHTPGQYWNFDDLDDDGGHLLCSVRHVSSFFWRQQEQQWQRPFLSDYCNRNWTFGPEAYCPGTEVP